MQPVAANAREQTDRGRAGVYRYGYTKKFIPALLLFLVLPDSPTNLTPLRQLRATNSNLPMPLLTIVPPMPGAERRFKPFVNFVQASGWTTEFVRLEGLGRRPPFGSTEIFPQVDAQTAGKVVMGFSLGALYSHLGALHARHLILGSISPFFLEDDDEPERWKVSYRAGNAHTPADVLVGAFEDEQMHRRATAVRDFYHRHTYTVVPEAEHELWHSNYLQAIKAALDRLKP
jgi:hypothetical protein